jgi:hypothetical protein
MKTIRLLLAAMVPLAAWSDAPAESKSAPWLVAQYERRMPTCKLEDRNVPIGTAFCKEGRTWRCGPSGNWEDTRKAC